MGEIESLEQQLKKKGYKLTGPRKILLGLLKDNTGKSLSAQQIYKLSEVHGIDFSTVYRNLDMMAKEGLLSTVQHDNGAFGYELCFDHHHHHLICTVCGATRCINFCPMELIDKSVWEGFTPSKHRFEITGICSECSKKQ